MEKTNFSEFNEKHINNISEDEEEVEEIPQEKPELNLSLNDGALYEDKKVTRSSKRKVIKKNLKEESIISNEENKQILNSNTKMTKIEKEKLKQNNYFEDFVKTIDTSNAATIGKNIFCDNFQIKQKAAIQIENVKSTEIEKTCSQKIEEITQSKNACKEFEIKNPVETKNFFNEKNEVNLETHNKSYDSNLIPSQAFSFSELGVQNKPTLSAEAANNVNKNSNEKPADKIVCNSLNINKLHANNVNNGNYNSVPATQLGISSLKNKLSLKVVIPVHTNKIPNDFNTETLSVKENKENLRNLHVLKENVIIFFCCVKIRKLRFFY